MIKLLQIINLLTAGFIIYLFINFIIKSIRDKNDIMGNPPINRFFFLIGKASNFTCRGILIYKTIKSFFVPYNPGLDLLIPSSTALVLSAILIYLSFKHLGDFNKFGLPEKKTAIIDSGIYSICRNPMYTGFSPLNFSSALYFPVTVNILLCVTGIIIHHFIVLGEEKFMEKTLGSGWVHYREKVRIYF